MDTELHSHVSILRDYSEYIRKLAADLSKNLDKFEQALGEQPRPHETNAGRCIEEMRELNNVLFSVEDSFHERLRLLLEEKSSLFTEHS
jgi:hypothetical protein